MVTEVSPEKPRGLLSRFMRGQHLPLGEGGRQGWIHRVQAPGSERTQHFSWVLRVSPVIMSVLFLLNQLSYFLLSTTLLLKGNWTLYLKVAEEPAPGRCIHHALGPWSRTTPLACKESCSPGVMTAPGQAAMDPSSDALLTSHLP